MYKAGNEMRGQGPGWLRAGTVGKGRVLFGAVLAEQRLVRNSKSFS